ncbi:hypothetical protein FOPE_08962 [Fonsecaea pedrosoi]|nr:hypothetical protein FOPE_08962 [Fonsecaea pedrosoi]
MNAESSQSDVLTTVTLGEQIASNDNTRKDIVDSSSATDDYDESDGDYEFDEDVDDFDEAQCLFCNQESPDLDQNLAHMLKAHGLYIDPAHLLVDVGTLLAYFHLIISGRHECLYCGTQRNTLEAVQQHMMAKGHCKYDTADEDAELRELFDDTLPYAKEDLLRHLHAMHGPDDTHLPSQARSRKRRPSKRPDKHGFDIAASTPDQVPPTSTSTSASQSNTDAEPASNANRTPSPSQGALSTRALKQECTLNNQLAQLRAGDQRSLLHLPPSQQRALLATHHKQTEKARRTEQISQSNLENAGNKVNCLGKIRLVRKPPHTGNIFSLNR